MASLQRIESAQELNTLFSDDEVAVVDFGTAWCGDSKGLRTELGHVAERCDRDQLPVRFFSVDATRHPSLGASLGLRSLPTTVFIADGKIQETAMGYLAATCLTQKVEALVNRSSEPLE